MRLIDKQEQIDLLTSQVWERLHNWNRNSHFFREKNRVRVMQPFLKHGYVCVKHPLVGHTLYVTKCVSDQSEQTLQRVEQIFEQWKAHLKQQLYQTNLNISRAYRDHFAWLRDYCVPRFRTNNDWDLAIMYRVNSGYNRVRVFSVYQDWNSNLGVRPNKLEWNDIRLAQYDQDENSSLHFKHRGQAIICCVNSRLDIDQVTKYIRALASCSNVYKLKPGNWSHEFDQRLELEYRQPWTQEEY